VVIVVFGGSLVNQTKRRRRARTLTVTNLITLSAAATQRRASGLDDGWLAGGCERGPASLLAAAVPTRSLRVVKRLEVVIDDALVALIKVVLVTGKEARGDRLTRRQRTASEDMRSAGAVDLV